MSYLDILFVSVLAGITLGISSLGARALAHRCLRTIGMSIQVPPSGRLERALSAIEQQTRLIQSQVADVLTDSTTGIANRRALDQEIVHQLHAWESGGRLFGLILIDLDHFKQVNDQYGHLVGDETLRSIAQLVSQTVGPRGMTARFGGEELAVILAECDAEQAARWAQRIRISIADAQVQCDDVLVKVTASLGVTVSETADDRRKILARADQALYASKHAGRNCCHFQQGTNCARIDAEPFPQSSHRGPAPAHPCVDSVTGLSSRQVFDEVLRHRVAETRRCQSSVSVILVQIDGFDGIQATGQHIERVVLTQVARFLAASMREMDLVARYEHHCFAILCPITTLGEAVIPAERLRREISNAELKFETACLNLTVSVGLAELTSGEDSWGLVRRARTALGEANRAGANQSCVNTGDRCLPVIGGRVGGKAGVRGAVADSV